MANLARRCLLSLVGAWLCVDSALVALADETVFPVQEAAFSASLVRIDREWNLHFRAAGSSAVRVLAAKDLAYWGRLRDVSAGRLVMLRDGGLLRADVLKLGDSEVVLGDATELGRGLWDESTLPRAAVRGIVVQPPAGQVERDALLARVQRSDDENTEHDVVFLSGGEELRGTIVSAPLAGRFAVEADASASDAFQISLPDSAEPITLAAAKVVALRLSGAAPARAQAARAAWMGFDDGSLLAAQSIQSAGGVGTVALAAGGKLTTQPLTGEGLWEALRYIEPVHDRTRWLSDLDSLGYVHIPFVSVERKFGQDRSVLGTRLRAGSGVWRKGLGMPSASRLAYDVAGYRHFAAELAIDEQAGLAGSVVFKVLLQSAAGDWKPAYESPIVRGGAPPIPIHLDLDQADRLALLIEFADRGDSNDLANWLSARLTK